MVIIKRIGFFHGVLISGAVAFGVGICVFPVYGFIIGGFFEFVKFLEACFEKGGGFWGNEKLVLAVSWQGAPFFTHMRSYSPRNHGEG